jgi:tetratricopeptide (TPR) repeat protein
MKKIILLILLFPTLSFADWVDDMQYLQTEWANVKYQYDSSDQQTGFEKLLEQADLRLKNNSNQAEVLIWHAIIEASYAGSLSAINPSALGYVKNAKKDLEKAIELGGDVLDGSAYTSLGSLYYQVPGWPIGFGDKDKANEYLRKGLEANPDGIDANYFYADFLIKKGEKEEAKVFLDKAKKAPSRPGRTVADQGRRSEVLELINKIKK